MALNQKRSRTPRASRLPQLPQSTPKRSTKMTSSTTPQTPSKLPLPATPSVRLSTCLRTDDAAVSTPTRIPMSKSPVVSRPAHLPLSHALLTPSPRAPIAVTQDSPVASPSPATTPPPMTAHSPYMFPTIADACITNSLIHNLTCGHKVLTQRPEACAANCSHKFARGVESYANMTFTADVFACPACVEEHVQLHLHAKRAVLSKMMHSAAQRMAKLPEDYAKTRFRRAESEWELEANWERKELLEVGRECQYVAEGDPNYEELASMKRKPRSIAVPWPRRQKFRKARSEFGARSLETLVESDE